MNRLYYPFRYIAFATYLFFCFATCTPDHSSSIQKRVDPKLLHMLCEELSDIMVHDIFSPPVASRIYMYSSVAAYEAAIGDQLNYRSLAGQLRELDSVPRLQTHLVNFQVASLYAYMEVAAQLVFSADKIDTLHQNLLQSLMPYELTDDVLEASRIYGATVGKHILSWANKDAYNRTRSEPKFSITEDPARWVPTPPAYMDAVEPHWHRIRPLVLDSASQFRPQGPVAFDQREGSPFWNTANEVYQKSKNLTEEESNIANFWDCNPYKMNVVGHIMHATKKISPGGHWMGITKIACQQAGVDFLTAIQAYTRVSIGLFDGFISCWDAKYTSNLLRPETYIHNYIDENWLPLLQTPPFPEHTSGHSVVSSSSAVLLTELFGENFSFEDTTEIPFGLPSRSYKSFQEAAEEASLSRFYGGIHYMPAITEGVKQGEKVARLILQKIQFTKE